jgi:hypothetical protein
MAASASIAGQNHPRVLPDVQAGRSGREEPRPSAALHAMRFVCRAWIAEGSVEGRPSGAAEGARTVMAECYCGCGRTVGLFPMAKRSANNVGMKVRECLDELQALQTEARLGAMPPDNVDGLTTM